MKYQYLVIICICFSIWPSLLKDLARSPAVPTMLSNHHGLNKQRLFFFPFKNEFFEGKKMTKLAKSLNLFVSLSIPYAWKKKWKLVGLGIWIHKITTILSFNKCFPSFPSKLLLPSSEGSCSNLHRGQKTSSWLGGRFLKSNLCPAHRKQPVNCFQTKTTKEDICQLLVVPWCPEFSRSLPHSWLNAQ